jgi:hypothetical protein
MREADRQPAPPESDGNASPATPSPNRMVRLEQQLGWGVVAATMTAVVGSWASGVLDGNGRAISSVTIGLGLAAVLAGAVWYGRRLITAFAAMAAGIAPVNQKSGYALISLFCLAYGGVLLFRNTLAQRKVAMSRPRRPPRSRKTPPVVPGNARRPSANRRYTPPKAKHPPRGH